MTEPIWTLVLGDGPLVAAAIHDGHAMRQEVATAHQLLAEERRREEDPYTAIWTEVVPTRIVGLRSRFEVDLNRPRDKAVYLKPEDCWGLRCWNETPSNEFVARSLEGYDAFYQAVHDTLSELTARYDKVVVLDLHSYNHRRSGPIGPAADAAGNPEVNIGTGTLDRAVWEHVVDACIEGLHTFDFGGRHLDVRENVKFQGGQFSRWIHENFPGHVASLAIEFKKFFMDEWTGEADREQVALIGQALASAAERVKLALKAL